MTVYIIHLNQPLSRGVSPRGTALQAGHYVGECDDIETRLQEHATSVWHPFAQPSFAEGVKRCGEKQGRGATFLAVANSRNITWSLARTWEGQGREFERRVKNCKNTARYCPLCNPRAMSLLKIS